jgi:hypothetical protein
MTDLQVSKRSNRHGLAAGIVLAALLAAPAALAQNAPLSYAVPDSSAWSDILKSDRKAQTSRPKAKVERKSAVPQRQAKSRPTKADGQSAAREAFASAPPQKPVGAADVRVVAPDELNEIDQMAGTTPQ